jgi:hypothetical protein
VCVFNKEGSLVAAQWISGAWVIVGTVTSTGDGGHINDVWYDHIMPVEIEGPTGVRNLRLGHNNGENPFTAAQRFIDQNELQQSYLGQIADWITARAGQTMPTIGTGASGVVGNPGTVQTECWAFFWCFVLCGDTRGEFCCEQSGIRSLQGAVGCVCSGYRTSFIADFSAHNPRMQVLLLPTILPSRHHRPSRRTPTKSPAW